MKAGFILVLIGVPLFFGPGIVFAEVGTGLIAIGAGLLLALVGTDATFEHARDARRSLGRALGAFVFAPHSMLVAAAGYGLIAFGIAMLVIVVIDNT